MKKNQSNESMKLFNNLYSHFMGFIFTGQYVVIKVTLKTLEKHPRVNRKAIFIINNYPRFKSYLKELYNRNEIIKIQLVPEIGLSESGLTSQELDIFKKLTKNREA